MEKIIGEGEREDLGRLAVRCRPPRACACQDQGRGPSVRLREKPLQTRGIDVFGDEHTAQGGALLAGEGQFRRADVDHRPGGAQPGQPQLGQGSGEKNEMDGAGQARQEMFHNLQDLGLGLDEMEIVLHQASAWGSRFQGPQQGFVRAAWCFDTISPACPDRANW
jgi:hypothetical protein